MAGIVLIAGSAQDAPIHTRFTMAGYGGKDRGKYGSGKVELTLNEGERSVDISEKKSDVNIQVNAHSHR